MIVFALLFGSPASVFLALSWNEGFIFFVFLVVADNCKFRSFVGDNFRFAALYLKG